MYFRHRCIVTIIAYMSCFPGGFEKRYRDDAVYITQLPEDITDEKIGETFGSIGRIKVVLSMSCYLHIKATFSWPMVVVLDNHVLLYYTSTLGCVLIGILFVHVLYYNTYYYTERS